jgi:SAM-dependent methyltransferase
MTCQFVIAPPLVSHLCNSTRDCYHYESAITMKITYDRSFYETMASDATRSSAIIVPLVLEYIRPTSIVDVGCGPGGWLAEFRKHGIEDVWGIDGPWVDPALLEIPKDRFRVADVAQPIRESRRFDLVVSLETAEHLHPPAARTFVESLTTLGSVVLFSAAIPFQGGYNHFNEQWPDYWAALFAEKDYLFVDCIRPRVWNNPHVDWWYAQNIFFAVERSRLGAYPALDAAASQTRVGQLSIVHPRAYVENAARAKTPSQLFQATLGAIKRSLQGKARTK